MKVILGSATDKAKMIPSPPQLAVLDRRNKTIPSGERGQDVVQDRKLWSQKPEFGSPLLSGTCP